MDGWAVGAFAGPPTFLALYWRGTTRAGVLAGLVTGTVVTIVWYATPALKNALYELIPAFGLSLLATWAMSMATRPPEGAERLLGVAKGEMDPVGASEPAPS